MGVLACDRNGCENIMCDYYSETYGYLCWECYNELLDKCDSMTIEMFMKTLRDDCWSSTMREYVQRKFKNRLKEEE